jgi:hypothetical protein
VAGVAQTHGGESPKQSTHPAAAFGDNAHPALVSLGPCSAWNATGPPYRLLLPPHQAEARPQANSPALSRAPASGSATPTPSTPLRRALAGGAAGANSLLSAALGSFGSSGGATPAAPPGSAAPQPGPASHGGGAASSGRGEGGGSSGGGLLGPFVPFAFVDSSYDALAPGRGAALRSALPALNDVLEVRSEPPPARRPLAAPAGPAAAPPPAGGGRWLDTALEQLLWAQLPAARRGGGGAPQPLNDIIEVRTEPPKAVSNAAAPPGANPGGGAPAEGAAAPERPGAAVPAASQGRVSWAALGFGGSRQQPAASGEAAADGSAPAGSCSGGATGAGAALGAVAAGGAPASTGASVDWATAAALGVVAAGAPVGSGRDGNGGWAAGHAGSHAAAAGMRAGGWRSSADMAAPTLDQWFAPTVPPPLGAATAAAGGTAAAAADAGGDGGSQRQPLQVRPAPPPAVTVAAALGLPAEPALAWACGAAGGRGGGDCAAFDAAWAELGARRADAYGRWLEAIPGLQAPASRAAAEQWYAQRVAVEIA